MSIDVVPISEVIVYPESDGQPLGESTLQVHWIVMIFTNLVDRYSQDDHVFVAADLFWYPVERKPKIVTAPDVMVAFDRPKGHRSSYLQWQEESIPPAVAFEIISPSNRDGEMEAKLNFYQQHGIKEYYIYNPYRHELIGYRRRGKKLIRIANVENFVSPLMQIRFELTEDDFQMYHPDGTPFVTSTELRQRGLEAQRRVVEAQRREVEAQQRAMEAQQRTMEAQQRATEQERKVEEAKIREQLLETRLREMGIDPDSI